MKERLHLPESLGMDYHLKEIVLKEEKEHDPKWDRYNLAPPIEGVKRLPNLSKINIFVGENNSGKSMFLRHLAAIEKMEFVPHLNLEQNWKWQDLAQVAENLRTCVQQCFTQQHIVEADGILRHLSSIPKLQYLQEDIAPVPQLTAFAERLSTITGLGSVQYSGGSYNPQSVLNQLSEFGKTLLNNFEKMPGIDKIPQYRFTKIYIPTLRGLRNLTNERDEKGGLKDIYRERTKNDYFTDRHPEIFTGLTLYNDTQRLLLGNLNERSKIRDFEKFLSENFFENKPIALIPKLDSTVLDIKIGDEAERPIFLLGDGIQSIIILTFPLFMNRDKQLLVFSEEPELYMHPSLQRALLSVFSRQFPENQYFLTTHSNHFLDLTLDLAGVSVYTFRKELEASGEERTARFEIENVSNEDTRSLELLGVRNSSVFLSNCSVWVEGITDRRYYRKYLTLYQETLPNELKRFKEDLHYSFVEYGGANITHFSFLDRTPDPIVVERLCSKLFLITDKDNERGEKAARHKELSEKLKERYYCLKCKEVENLIAPATLKLVVAQYETSEPKFNEFTQQDYQDVSLGEFIDSKVLKGLSSRAAPYAKDNTVRDKPEFCLKAIEAMKSFDDLSPEAKDIAKRLYDFIASNNK